MKNTETNGVPECTASAANYPKCTLRVMTV